MRTAATVTPGRWARLLLLVATLVGLGAMHTLGHGTHPSGHGHPAEGRHLPNGPAAAAVALVEAGQALPAARHDVGPAAPALAGHAVEAAMPGCPGGCGQDRLVPAGGGGGGNLPGWSVCLAVLGALAVSLLVAVLLAASVGVGRLARRIGPAVPASRAPPPAPFGLHLATVAVLRR